MKDTIKETQHSQVNNQSKETQDKIKVVKEKIKAAQPEKQSNPIVQDQSRGQTVKGGNYNGMLRHPTIQSKSQIDVRIKSDKPIEIVKAQSDKHTEMNVDVFNFGW